MEKKAKGWMAMRGGWGRKKRSIATQIREREEMGPFHGRLSTDMDYQGLRGVHKSHGIQAWGNLSKKHIPRLDEHDLVPFTQFYPRPAKY